MLWVSSKIFRLQKCLPDDGNILIGNEDNCGHRKPQDKIHSILCNVGREYTQTGGRRSWGCFAFISVFTFTQLKSDNSIV